MDSDAEIFFTGSGGSGTYEFYFGDSLVSSPLVLPGNGDYEIRMEDALGCEITKNIHIAASENISIVSSIIQPSCSGIQSGYAVFTASGGLSPYDYSWSDGGTGSSRNSLPPGDYSIDVTDANGCLTSKSFTINGIASVTAEIEAPEEVACNAEGNTVISLSSNATDYTWEISSEDESWSITNSAADMATFASGNGSATMIFTAWNDAGCRDSDTLNLACNPGDTGTGTGDSGGGDGSGDGSGDGGSGDGNDGGSGDGNGNGGSNGGCTSSCWETMLSTITPLGNHCYHMELEVETTGYCEHDLSHLVVGLDGGYISHLSNSWNFKQEINSTDPKSGVYGFKIDDISGFGNNGSERLIISYDVCFTDTDLPDVIPVIYKASTCEYIQDLEIADHSVIPPALSVSAWPNPFAEEINIMVNSPVDMQTDIAIIDLRGNIVAKLYKGKLAAHVNYTFPFDADNTTDNIFIYRIITSDTVLQGQILKVR